jgi:hypothetical protein
MQPIRNWGIILNQFIIIIFVNTVEFIDILYHFITSTLNNFDIKKEASIRKSLFYANSVPHDCLSPLPLF